jgi:hypothetical protein
LVCEDPAKNLSEINIFFLEKIRIKYKFEILRIFKENLRILKEILRKVKIIFSRFQSEYLRDFKMFSIFLTKKNILKGKFNLKL